MPIIRQKKGANDKMEKRVIKISLIGTILTVLAIVALIIAGVFITRKIYIDRQNEADIVIDNNKNKK